MKCTKCGTEVGEEDFFCPTCGNNLTQSRPLTPNIKSQEILPTNTFVKFTYSKSHTIVNFISLVSFLIWFVICLTLRIMVEAITQHIAFSGLFKWVFSFLAISILLCGTMCAIRCVIFYNMCLCVYNNKIIGVSGKNLCFATETFEIEYPNIINIKQKGNLIIIETNIKIYKCAIQDAKQAYDMIMNLRNNKNYRITA